MHSVLEIGQAFLDKAKKEGKQLNAMQLIKLTYIAHGMMLAAHGKPLIKEDIEVWKFGPVIKKLYIKIKHTRGTPITENIAELPKLSEEEESVINDVFAQYAHLSGWKLSQMTHEKGTPWDQSKREKIIPEETIKKYYKNLLMEKSNRGIDKLTTKEMVAVDQGFDYNMRNVLIDSSIWVKFLYLFIAIVVFLGAIYLFREMAIFIGLPFVLKEVVLPFVIAFISGILISLMHVQIVKKFN